MPNRNKAIVTLICLFFSLSGLFGCTRDDSSTDYVEMTITCNTSYRSSVFVPIEKQASVSLDSTNPSQEVRYADLVFLAQYESGRAAYESRSFLVRVTTTEEDKGLHQTLYQMKENQLTENQFIGGHGFTGLVYINNPSSQAELQYWCSTK